MKRLVILFLVFLIPIYIFGQNGVITQINGTVELKHSGSDNYVIANVGNTVNNDTIIFTGVRSSAIIQIGNTYITVRPITRLTLREIHSSSNEETLNVSLQTGRLRVDVSPPAGTRSFTTIQTPSATASVRGTVFNIDTRTLMVEQGSVSYKGNRGYAIQANAGTISTVTASGTATAPAAVSLNQASGLYDTDVFNTGTLDPILGPGYQTGSTAGSPDAAGKNNSFLDHIINAFYSLITAPFNK